jgi:tetratricopeptide (TPR) repeat protein
MSIQIFIFIFLGWAHSFIQGSVDTQSGPADSLFASQAAADTNQSAQTQNTTVPVDVTVSSAPATAAQSSDVTTVMQPPAQPEQKNAISQTSQSSAPADKKDTVSTPDITKSKSKDSVAASSKKDSDAQKSDTSVAPSSKSTDKKDAPTSPVITPGMITQTIECTADQDIKIIACDAQMAVIAHTVSSSTDKEKYPDYPVQHNTKKDKITYSLSYNPAQVVYLFFDAGNAFTKLKVALTDQIGALDKNTTMSVYNNKAGDIDIKWSQGSKEVGKQQSLKKFSVHKKTFFNDTTLDYSITQQSAAGAVMLADEKGTVVDQISAPAKSIKGIDVYYYADNGAPEVDGWFIHGLPQGEKCYISYKADGLSQYDSVNPSVDTTGKVTIELKKPGAIKTITPKVVDDDAANSELLEDPNVTDPNGVKKYPDEAAQAVDILKQGQFALTAACLLLSRSENTAQSIEQVGDAYKKSADFFMKAYTLFRGLNEKATGTWVRFRLYTAELFALQTFAQSAAIYFKAGKHEKVLGVYEAMYKMYNHVNTHDLGDAARELKQGYALLFDKKWKDAAGHFEKAGDYYRAAGDNKNAEAGAMIGVYVVVAVVIALAVAFLTVVTAGTATGAVAGAVAGADAGAAVADSAVIGTVAAASAVSGAAQGAVEGGLSGAFFGAINSAALGAQAATAALTDEAIDAAIAAGTAGYLAPVIAGELVGAVVGGATGMVGGAVGGAATAAASVTGISAAATAATSAVTAAGTAIAASATSAGAFITSLAASSPIASAILASAGSLVTGIGGLTAGSVATGTIGLVTGAATGASSLIGGGIGGAIAGGFAGVLTGATVGVAGALTAAFVGIVTALPAVLFAIASATIVGLEVAVVLSPALIAGGFLLYNNMGPDQIASYMNNRYARAGQYYFRAAHCYETAALCYQKAGDKETTQKRYEKAAYLANVAGDNCTNATGSPKLVDHANARDCYIYSENLWNKAAYWANKHGDVTARAQDHANADRLKKAAEEQGKLAATDASWGLGKYNDMKQHVLKSVYEYVTGDIDDAVHELEQGANDGHHAQGAFEQAKKLAPALVTKTTGGLKTTTTDHDGTLVTKTVDTGKLVTKTTESGQKSWAEKYITLSGKYINSINGCIKGLQALKDNTIDEKSIIDVSTFILRCSANLGSGVNAGAYNNLYFSALQKVLPAVQTFAQSKITPAKTDDAKKPDPKKQATKDTSKKDGSVKVQGMSDADYGMEHFKGVEKEEAAAFDAFVKKDYLGAITHCQKLSDEIKKANTGFSKNVKISGKGGKAWSKKYLTKLKNAKRFADACKASATGLKAQKTDTKSMQAYFTFLDVLIHAHKYNGIVIITQAVLAMIPGLIQAGAAPQQQTNIDKMDATDVRIVQTDTSKI